MEDYGHEYGTIPYFRYVKNPCLVLRAVSWKGEEITGNTQVVILDSIHTFRNFGPGAVVWLLAVKRLRVHMGGYFVSLLLAPARALPDAQLLALACTNSKQLHSPIGFAFGHCTWLVVRPTLPRSQASPDCDRRGKQTRKSQSNYRTSWAHCVHPTGKKDTNKKWRHF